jgi:hypothetical protein
MENDPKGGAPRGLGSRLAARFRQAVTDREAERRRAEDEAARAMEQARRARTELLADLRAFAREIGAVEAVPDGDGLTLRYGERFVHFEPEGDRDRVRVEVEGAGDEEHYLYRQPELGDRWVYARRRRLREDRMPLFDQGLEDLLVRGLGLPPPADVAPDPDRSSPSGLRDSGAPPSKKL